ncbi:PLAC8-domain-containing protein [Microthyrium microscopicum]|uniref:PLAC8-domain-containing protein n=1 Tax=Microthyrium microscopicum TaxID=703497 RepID=A0A6A6U684_9PEZI|nr:PLAC8-domain-containing protein [Microthyrium microscopicum]
MSNEWHNSGSDCCSPFSTCALAWCCPCFVHGRVQHRVNKDGMLNGYSSCNMNCCAWACLAHFGCQWILQMMSRGEIRRKYNLKGDGCTDCLCACCCTPCDLAQQDKEAEHQEKQRLMGNGAQAINVQPLKMDGGMVYGQQQQFQQHPQQPQAMYHATQ